MKNYFFKIVEAILFSFPVLIGIASTSIAMNNDPEYEKLWTTIKPTEPNWWQGVEEIRPFSKFSYFDGKWLPKEANLDYFSSMNDIVRFQSALSSRKAYMTRSQAFELMEAEEKEYANIQKRELVDLMEFSMNEIMKYDLPPDKNRDSTTAQVLWVDREPGKPKKFYRGKNLDEKWPPL